ncbi:RES family NAD+ phosphorylase [Pseudoalteromonas sp. Of11M-6]|uniref:RES family NAD+ phosphorylase n=1 Tax=Pseudoalteromonas sp. Of11M-6 TaxID=2917754 RepID=UPI001EF47B60|nr:RES family NAD+ phosphorylase [Pseudoalteromonas sp. Of11M-6]MCG7553980.1 RES family NAD+ phosphorylase [Pseudoalteromonas sp. Of11M-6]
MSAVVLCSDCFNNPGLKRYVEELFVADLAGCPHCDSTEGHCLSGAMVIELADKCFLHGEIAKAAYYNDKNIERNKQQKLSSSLGKTLKQDILCIENAINDAYLENTDSQILLRALESYPVRVLTPSDQFYRIRVSPEQPQNSTEYDSPPDELLGSGRLDSDNMPVMYASQNLQICIHECRAAANDSLFVATLRPTSHLKLLDLTCIAAEPLQKALHMVFMFSRFSYPLTRRIAVLAKQAGFDGIIYPATSTILAKIDPKAKQQNNSKVVENIAMFGRPILDSLVEVVTIEAITSSNQL